MRQVTLLELKTIAQQSYYGLWTAARNLGRDVKLYCHWTGGYYDQLFNDYHVLITGDGRVFVSTEYLAEIKNATYMRNTGSVAIALCCAYNAKDENNLGYYPPTEAQMNALAQVICVIADALDLTIDADRVLTHAEAANNIDGLNTHEDYGPYSGDPQTKWDLLVVEEGAKPWTGGNVIRGNANWYRGQRLLR